MKKSYIFILIVFIVNINAMVQLILAMRSLLGDSVQYYILFFSIALLCGTAMPAELMFYFEIFENKRKNKEKDHELKSGNGHDAGDGLGDTGNTK